MRPVIALIVFLFAVAICGCSHVVSPQGRAAVVPGSRLDMVRVAPEVHLGEQLLVGGNILGLTRQEEETAIEIYSWKLDQRGEPLDFDHRGGRFLAVTGEGLDPQAFSPSRFVTLVGAVEGVETREIDGSPYRLPLLRVVEIHALDLPLRYDGPPRLDAPSPLPAPWYETANPYDPNNSQPARDHRPLPR